MPIRKIRAKSAVNDNFNCTPENVQDIRTAIVCLLNRISSLIEIRDGKAPISYKTFFQEFCLLNETIFESLTNRYLHWSSSKNARSKSSTRNYRKSFSNINLMSNNYAHDQADRFLKAFMSAFEQCRKSLVFALKRRSEKEHLLTKTLEDTERKLEKQTNAYKLLEEKLNLFNQSKNFQVPKSPNLYGSFEKNKLNDMKFPSLETKLTTIDQHKKSKNKEIISSNNKSSESFESFVEFETRFEEKIHSLKERIKVLEYQLKRESLRKGKQENYILHERLESVERQLFVKDQELYLSYQQNQKKEKQFVSLIHGLHQDYEKISEIINKEQLEKGLAPYKEELKFRTILQYINQAVDTKNIEVITTRLPSHYSYVDQKLSNAKDEKFDTNITNFISVSNSSNKSEVKSNSKIKPTLVNPKTGRADLLKIMKEFPYLTFTQIDKLWKQFKLFDKNNDLSLDMKEMIEVIREKEMLDLVSEKNVREALKEIDSEDCDCIDFYEFLKIGEMIMKKQGRSEVFKYQLLNRKDLSGNRFCHIQ